MAWKSGKSKKNPWAERHPVTGQIKRFRTERDAIRWKVDEEKAWKNRKPGGELTIGALRDRYLKSIKTELVEKSQKDKKRGFTRLLEFVDETVAIERPGERLVFSEIEPVLRETDPVSVLSEDIVDSFMAWAAENHRGGGANNYRKALGSAWTYGMDIRLIPRIVNPWHATPKKRVVKRPKVVPSYEDFLKVVNAVKFRQDQIMLWTYFYTGARMDELFRAVWDDIDFKNKRIRLWSMKNPDGEYRQGWVNLTTENYKLLKEQHKATGHQEYVFLTQTTKKSYSERRHFMDQACDRAGVTRFGLGSLRNLSASILLLEGADPVEIMRHCRHDHVTTTMKYIRDLREEMDQKASINSILESKYSPSDSNLVKPAAAQPQGKNVIQFPGAKKKSSTPSKKSQWSKKDVAGKE